MISEIFSNYGWAVAIATYVIVGGVFIYSLLSISK